MKPLRNNSAARILKPLNYPGKLSFYERDDTTPQGAKKTSPYKAGDVQRSKQDVL